MKTNQSQYITYRGARYERILTLNEIRVDPIPPRCCAVIVGLSRGKTWFEKSEFYNMPAVGVPGILRQEALETLGYDDPEELDEFFSVKKLDQYTYCGSYSEESIYMVSTRKNGVGSNVYELLEQGNKDTIANEVINIINSTVGPNWEF